MTDSTFFAAVKRPGRYLGNEYNSITKNWQNSQVRFALIFPDLYEIGMSHQGLQILYHLINSNESWLAERCYCPDLDAEELLRHSGQPLTSLESEKPLAEFDALGITLPYELCYTNILTVLDLAGLPFYSNQRDETHPLIIGGGPCSLNPEPVAPFFDAILLGDGEEAILEISGLIAEMKSQQLKRSEQLDRLAEIEGVYIPAHYRVSYTENADQPQVSVIEHLGKSEVPVRRRVVADLDNVEHLKKPLVPNAKIVHDRLGIEVARGCTRGCRFCQAGITYRPVRERKVETILDLADRGLSCSGFEELALLSLSTGDYSCLDQALPKLMDSYASDYVSVAMPSMRVGTLTPEIMEQVKRVRKTGFTLAPEAGSERLRRVINKGITEEDLLDTCRQAFALGWLNIKLYFMIGLPTETDEDILEITRLVEKIQKISQQSGGRGKKQITVSVGTFVPKPHTPFQWHGQLSQEESGRKLRELKESLPRKGCSMRYHSPRISFLEGVFSRGDRRLAQLIEACWLKGGRLDGWDEHFDLPRWEEAARQCGLQLESYLTQRSADEILPWSHLSSGLDESFFKTELEKAHSETYTPDCRYHACQKCGLCDFKTIKPVVHNRNRYSEAATEDSTGDDASEKALPQEQNQSKGQSIVPGQKGNAPFFRKNPHGDNHFRYLVEYQRTGRICYLGHLEILQLVFRSLRRAEIPTNFSLGFNPSPKVSFGPALAVRTESFAEYFIMDLYEPLKSTSATLQKLNEALAPGLTVTGVRLHSGKIPQRVITAYRMDLQRPITEDEKTRLQDFKAAASFPVSKTRKGKTKEIDIRPLCKKIELDGPNSVLLELLGEAALPGIKPMEAIGEILKLTPEETTQLKITKLHWEKAD